MSVEARTNQGPEFFISPLEGDQTGDEVEGKLGGEMEYKRLPLKLNNEIVGTILVGTSFARFNARAERSLWLNIIILSVVLLLLIVYASIILGILVINPLRKVSGS